MSSEWLQLTNDQQLWTIRNDNSHYADTPDDIQCPWCSAKQSLEHEDVSYEDDNTSEYECQECGKMFDVHTSVSYSFDTELPQDYLIKKAKKEVPNV